ncbi:type II CAAX endopeptidase family protein [Salinibacterium sp. ZJ454]|uniref:CPBP family intramembrane glutamic endopeptidase n=1 Tax=Salinibacterium sp. ZJ454 TaxID=2708339 RepID=UPI001420BDCB|nr:type II CAAX endopeptidase family protein [Salinibacterium sp. ZJ454]
MTVRTPRPDAARSDKAGLTGRSLIFFFVATFVVSWGAGISYVLFQEQVDAIFGPMQYTNPVFIFMVYAPGIVGVLMVLRHYGMSGLGRFFRRFALWRMSLVWWLVLLVGIPAVYYAGAAVTGSITDPFPFTAWATVLQAMLAMLLIGPIEELGWRGVALPLLQRRLAPLWSAILLGVIVAIWHAPSFFLSGTKQAEWAFWPFFFGVVAISVILAALFNASRGSLLVAFLFHAQLNNPIWPDGQPWDMWIFVAVAVVVAVANRKAMLDRSAGVTAVLASTGAADDAAPENPGTKTRQDLTTPR